MKLFNKTKNVVVAANVRRAGSFSGRMKGLLGRGSLEQGEALHIIPCNSIHTFFMKFPIDAVFIGQTGRVVGIYRHLKPWRLSGVVWKARSVVELEAGTVQRTGLSEGDEVVFED